MSSDDRDHIRQQRRAERERKEKEFQDEMARYEAERQARLEARRKAREVEAASAVSSGVSSRFSSSSSLSTDSQASSSSSKSPSKPSSPSVNNTEAEDWEKERKERLAEREREAQERKAALEAQLAQEEAERKAKAEERRKARELERQKEEQEEAARKARLEERRREREAQRLAEEKEYEERQAARKKARDEKRKDSNPNPISISAPAVVSPTPMVATTSTRSEKSTSPLAIPITTISSTDSPADSPGSEAALGTSGPSSLTSSLPIPRPDSPGARVESPARRKRLGELGRASDSPRMTTQSPDTTTGISLTASTSSVEAEEAEKQKKASERKAKEAAQKQKDEEEAKMLKAAADAEMAAQAAADAAIREEMRKEEEELLAKEKEALAKREAAAKMEPKKEAASATPSSSNSKPADTSTTPNGGKKSAIGQLRLQNKMRFSTTERPIGQVPPPITHRLTTMELFSVGGGGGAKRLPDPDLLMNHFVREGRLSRDCVTEILLQIRTAFLYEKNIVTVSAPTTVVGDIHGQFYDLLHLFKSTGLPGAGDDNWVFLGDYVDRGTFSCEVCLILFVCKLRYPSKVTLLRGNHETRAMSSYHNFQQEATHKYGQSVYDMFMEVFDHLPLAAIIDSGGSLGRIFACHGGLSPAFKTVDEVQELDRVSEPPDEGALCDLIWADPVEDDKFFNQNFSRNKERGCSVVFGYYPIYDFLDANNFTFMIRAHQVEERGFREMHFSQAPPGRAHPMVVTLFSAPNYCDSYENMAAYLTITADEYNFHQYSWQPHPYCLPDFNNAFKFSLPFVAENIMKFLVSIVETIHSTEDDTHEDEGDADKTMEAKLRLVGKSFIALKKMREQSMGKLGNIVEQQQKAQQQQQSLVSSETQQTIDQLRSKGGRRKVQRVVSDLSEIVKMAHSRFKAAKEADKENERFHGRVAWKSTFRKLGRGVSFKV